MTIELFSTNNKGDTVSLGKYNRRFKDAVATFTGMFPEYWAELKQLGHSVDTIFSSKTPLS